MSENNSNSNKKPLDRIKSKLFERSLTVAKIGIKAGLKLASHKIQNHSLEESLHRFLLSDAESITKDLGELKGSLMKAGQMLSMYGEYFFPPQANEFLKKLQSESPPLDFNFIQTILKSELSEDLLSELEIDPSPIGTASLGQVHKARIIKTNEMIALKVQYPDVDLAIDSDIKALKTLLKFSKLIPDGIDLTQVFEEIKKMLIQELDYNQELSLTEKYHESLLKIDPDQIKYKVPKVYPRYSNKKILATEYIEGVRADSPMIQALSEKRRVQIAENFLDLYYRELFDWNLVQTDPHFGNYKIQINAQGNDRIVLLDFGATNSFSESFIQSYRKMIQSSIEGNTPRFLEASHELGFMSETDTREYIETFTQFCFELVEPFWSPNDPRNIQKKVSPEGLYHWKKTDLPTRMVKKAINFKKFDLRTPPQELLFIDRKTAGVFIFISTLDVHLNARKIIEPYFLKS